MPQCRSSRWYWAAAAITVAGLALSACASAPSPVGPAGGPSSPARPSASPTASAASDSRPLAPLTGLPAASAAAAHRPAVAVDLAGPDPTGLTSADLVLQEFTSPVRYIAVFQSRSATVGPVTGTQPTDGAALSVLHPLIGYDGGAAPYFVTLLDKSKVKDAGFSHYPSLYTTGPQGLTVSTKAIAGAVPGATAPPPLFQYRGAQSGASTLAGTGLSRPTSARVTIPGYGTEEWTFDQHADKWVLTGGGPRVQAANVVVQTVTYKQIGINASVGRTTQSAHLTGTGRVEVLSASAAGHSGGTAAGGTWARPYVGKVTVYLDSSGTPMSFQPGSTWVILAPPGTRVSTSG
jgi:Protein of unknown function (DUF3048) C-terminal domain/Protein of unknown function (DUF3048) N-terminal domain